MFSAEVVTEAHMSSLARITLLIVFSQVNFNSL